MGLISIRISLKQSPNAMHWHIASGSKAVIQFHQKLQQ